MVVHPKADPSEFARLDGDGRPAEGVLLNDCHTDGAPFGLLASGGRMRLFAVHRAVGSAAADYVELDAERLQLDDLPFLAVLGPSYLATGVFADLEAEARRYGAELRKRIDSTIRLDALPKLARSFGAWAKEHGRDISDDKVRQDFEHAALTLVFRLLFVFYAESAGYLPMDNRSYRQHSLTALVEEASATVDQVSAKSTALWLSFVQVVRALRLGNPAWEVPAYNGALFAADGFDGAETLEALEMSDPDFAAVLLALGRDDDSDRGVDYSTLEIGHLGHVYEGLLSLRLSVADTALRYDAGKDRYAPATGSESDVAAGELLWQTHEGGRKGGGVYYTRTELVRHLVAQAVVPTFDSHLERVRKTAAQDPSTAADQLFDFTVLDPACGSAHFLVEVVDVLADRIVTFLAETPLPRVRDMLDRLRAGASVGVTIDDVTLLRRLVLKRCVFGVDVSPMGAEVAKLSLWLASFVPGLSLAYLGRNVVVGNSLVGVARAEALRADGKGGTVSWLDAALEPALKVATDAVARVAAIDDRSPEEYAQSETADAEAREATSALTRLFDLWTAEPFGVGGARHEVELRGADILAGKVTDLTATAEAIAAEHRFLHWMLEFPQVFAREHPGFDAVIGNPPWEEVTVEELAFYALFEPGIRSLPTRERAEAIAALLTRRPDLSGRLEAAKRRASTERAYFPKAEYESMPGDPDLYKFFCQRYRTLLRDGGRLGVVLPRSAFLAKGSRTFRKWLFEEMTTHRVDFLLNKARWAFDKEPRYTDSLVAAERRRPDEDHRVAIAGVADSLNAWNVQAASGGVALAADGFGAHWMTPLLRGHPEAELLRKLRHGSTFPFGARGRWQCFPVRELDESLDKKLWEKATDGRPLWKGESFDQYEPHGAESRPCPQNDAVDEKVRKVRPGAESDLTEVLTLTARRQAVIGEIGSSARRISRRQSGDGLTDHPRVSRSSWRIPNKQGPVPCVCRRQGSRTSGVPRSHEQPHLRLAGAPVRGDQSELFHPRGAHCARSWRRRLHRDRGRGGAAVVRRRSVCRLCRGDWCQLRRTFRRRA